MTEQRGIPDFDTATLLRLIDRLGVEDDEVGVLSVLYDRDESGLRLRHATLRFGPAAIGEANWATWHRSEQARASLNYAGAGGLPPEWLCDQGDFLAGRAVLARDTALAWLADIVSTGSLPDAGAVPAAAAALRSPSTFLHIFPQLDTPLSRYAVLSRPLEGFFLPTEARPERDYPDTWPIDGHDVFGAPVFALAIALKVVGDPASCSPPEGLLVGRMERRAWLIDARGTGDYEHFDLHVRWDPNRIDLVDLEVELEEWEGDELVYSRRLPLGELDLPNRQSTDDRGVLSLPTLGRQLRHGARLHDRDGNLLDVTFPHWIIEQVNMRISTSAAGAGSESNTDFSVGQAQSPTVRDRLERLDRAEIEYRTMLEDGLAGRIIRDPASAFAFIQGELGRARCDLLILDPYFGANPADWQVLHGVSVPVRVLTGGKAQPPTPPATNVVARRYKFKGAPGFHDRLYLWDGGGLSVGTSPSGLGKRDARIDRLGTVEAAAWRALFETYWASPDYVDL